MKPATRSRSDAGLGTEFLAAGGHLLAAGRRLLGDLRHCLDGLRDFLGVGGLLDGGRGDLGDLRRRGFDALMICFKRLAGLVAELRPFFDALRRFLDQRRDLRAAWFERSASLRTSSATTAKPMPCSPARAASMAAFRASRLVWLAISEITWMISLICCDCCRISSIDSIDFCTAVPPSSASVLVSLGHLVGLVGVVLDRLDAAGQFFDRGGHLLDGRALRLGTLGQGLRAFARYAQPSVNCAAPSVTCMMTPRGRRHRADAGGQFVDGLVAVDGDLLRQVASAAALTTSSSSSTLRRKFVLGLALALLLGLVLASRRICSVMSEAYFTTL